MARDGFSSLDGFSGVSVFSSIGQMVSEEDNPSVRASEDLLRRGGWGTEDVCRR
jgi:hypothetical protein